MPEPMCNHFSTSLMMTNAYEIINFKRQIHIISRSHIHASTSTVRVCVCVDHSSAENIRVRENENEKASPTETQNIDCGIKNDIDCDDKTDFSRFVRGKKHSE